MTPSYFNIESNNLETTSTTSQNYKNFLMYQYYNDNQPSLNKSSHHRFGSTTQQQNDVNQFNSSQNSLVAKLFASSGFRRRSYDDQEGDNDFNIILQPSDIDEIENKAKANYAQFKATATYTGSASSSHNAAASTHQTSKSKHLINLQSLEACQRQFIAENNNRTATKEKTKRSSPRTSRRLNEATKLTALTNIFEDIKLAKCLLDQDYKQTVRLFIQKSALNWNFNAFTFDALCCGRSLTELLLHLFDYYNLYAVFKLDIIKVLKCFRLLEFGYHSTNPYHNSVHAADVTQAMHCFIQETKIRRHMTNLEILSSILAAVCHDLDHPGVNQSFLVATKNPLAGLYHNTSVLENHHWRFALCIFKESQLFDHFDKDTMDDMKEQLKHLILATDIARQNEYLRRFKEMTSSQEFSMSHTPDRALVLQMALKCADLGNPCRPWMISRVWSNLICDEFYRMGQIERRLGVPLTPICQREKTSIAGIQTGFFRFIVLPLLELWHGFLVSPLSDLLMTNFDHNYRRWQRANRIVQQLRRRKSVACLEPTETGAECEVSDENNSVHGCPTNGRHDRSSSLFVDPVIADIYTKHSFKAVKRASSDYIKSGNGHLEMLRDFQLNRMIEKSPRIERAYLRQGDFDNRPRKTNELRTKLDQATPEKNCAPSMAGRYAKPTDLSKEANDGASGGQPEPGMRTGSLRGLQHQSAAPLLTSAPINILRDYSSIFRQALSPIQDGDSASPDQMKAVPPLPKGSTTSSMINMDVGGANLNDFDQDSPASSPTSRASSASSSPVNQKRPPAITSRTFMDSSQRLLQQRLTNHPYASHYHDSSPGGRKLRPANIGPASRQSVTHNKSTFYNNMRRRESDPGSLTDELAAAIVLIQYQSNNLFHKRRSSLPICMPKRRSSK